MPITQSPPPNQQQSGPTFSARLPRHAEEQELHFLLEETADERDRGRVREAVWISIIIHMVVIFILLILPKYLPKHPVIAQKDVKDHELTYLDLPKNLRPTPPKPSDVIANKNQVQQSPLPDQKTLQRLLQSQRPGPPTPPQQPQMAQQQQQFSAPVQPQVPAQNTANITPPVNTPQQNAQLQQPAEQKTPDFKALMSSAGRNIQQAARNSAHDNPGNSGNYGVGQTPHPGMQSGVDIVSDTMGVDFGPYLQRVVHDVRINWYNLIPEEALPPMMKQGKVAIQFSILKDGSISGLKIIAPSGDMPLDRAAQGGITASNPFPPLPSEFAGQYLALRFYFYYNPKDPNNLQ